MSIHTFAQSPIVDPYVNPQPGASERAVQFELAQHPVSAWDSLHVPATWPGPINRLPYRFNPACAAWGGLRQHGDKQDMSGLFGSAFRPAPWIPRLSHMARANNGVTNKFSAGTGNVGIPAVFVPTASVNWYGGKATQ